MRHALRYPFDLATLLRKHNALRDELLAGGPFVELRLAVLGGSTTAQITRFLELFLLEAKIAPTFYESEYNKFYEDVMVDDRALRAFAPQIVFVHTTHRNVERWPRLFDSPDQVEALAAAEHARFEALWARLLSTGDRLIIQNNFDQPLLDSLGHLTASAGYGQRRFLQRLNARFAEAAEREPRLRINDIDHLSASLGLKAWSDERHWLSYKMAVTQQGALAVAHQAAKIVRAALGKSKKVLVLDLDNTLWGGVIGDDGVANLRLGKETAEAEAFTAFQRYCRTLKERGVVLAVCSKNELETAKLGFTHPDMVLGLNDFSAFEASFQPKPDALRAIARKLGLGTDALVFVDDDAVERARVAAAMPEVAIADSSDVARVVEQLDREGYFEPFALTHDDAARTQSYAQNAEREALRASAHDEDAFLASLQMSAEIAPFAPVYLDRIAQLTNKTNQFNLTTARHTQAEIAAMASSQQHVTLYGRLSDRFGDNGLVSVVAGEISGADLHVILWLMSCRVLKRTMELAMFDALIEAARARGVRTIIGRYNRTPKNGMVEGFFSSLGFVERDRSAESVTYSLAVEQAPPRCRHIRRT